MSSPAQVGQVLSVSSTAVYYWYRSGVLITGENSPTYKTTAADDGHTVTGIMMSMMSMPVVKATIITGGGVLDFSKPANSGLVGAIV